MKKRKTFIKFSIAIFLGLNINISGIGFNNNSYAEVLKMEALVNAESLNIRKLPDTKSEIITSSKKGSKLNILSISDDNNWYKISTSGRTGWVDKKYVTTQVIGSSNYNVVSTIGSVGASPVVSNAVKSTFNKNYRYVLNMSDKTNLKIYDKNNNFINSIEFYYPWALEKKDLDNIVLAVDDENNIYTNNNARNSITKYDSKGLKLLNLGPELLGEVSYLTFNSYDQTLYTLDYSTKSIKGFNKEGLNTKNIFLSETRVPKSFYIFKDNLYVLDYPENENEYYPVYYVNSYSFELRNNYDPKAKVTETVSKGSILKNDPSARTYKNKVFIDKEQTKTKDVTWIDFSDTEKKFGLSDDLKKVDALGEIDIYKSDGTYRSNVSLNDKWSLKSPDRHRTNENDLVRKIKGVLVDSNSNLILPVLTNSKKSNFSSLNYYYMNLTDKSYKISQPIPFDGEKLTYFYDGDVFTSIPKGNMISLDNNGIEKQKLGLSSPSKFNYAYKINFDDNLYVFDRINYSMGKYDLNGEPLKVLYREQKSDLYNYEDIYFTKEKTWALKSLVVEDKKVGLEIFDDKFNRIYDKWLITLANDSPKPEISVNDKNEVFIFGKGTYFNKKVTLSMFNDKGQLINSWQKESDLSSVLDEDDKKGIRDNSIKFLGFDKKSNMYLLLKKGADNKIYKININTQGRGQVVKIFDTSFFGDMVTNEDKTTTRRFDGNLKSEILNIEEGKQGFTYMLVRDNNTKQIRLGIFDPSGNFWKESYFLQYSDINDFTLDNADNIWFSQGNILQKFANYN